MKRVDIDVEEMQDFLNDTVDSDLIKLDGTSKPMKKEVCVKIGGMWYRKLKGDEEISRGAVHKYKDGPYNLVVNEDTFGQTPSAFSEDRSFYAPTGKRLV